MMWKTMACEMRRPRPAIPALAAGVLRFFSGNRMTGTLLLPRPLLMRRDTA
jgi:hypothetical protein